MHRIKVIPSSDEADSDTKDWLASIADLGVLDILYWTSDEAANLRKMVHEQTGTFRPRTRSTVIAVLRSNGSLVMAFVDPTLEELALVRAHIFGRPAK